MLILGMLMMPKYTDGTTYIYYQIVSIDKVGLS